MSNNHDLPIQIIAFLFIGGIILFFHSLKKIKQKLKIKNIAKQLISSASAGSVEIEGVAWPLRSFSHSLDGKKIVCRSVTIKKKVQRGKNKSYETVWSKCTTTPFLIFDHTGYLLVEPTYSHNLVAVYGEIDEKKYSPNGLSELAIQGFNEFYDNSVAGFQVSSSRSFLSKLFSADFIILERVIEIGSPLLIHGYLTPDDGARFVLEDANLLSFREKISRILKNKSLKLSLLDKDKDGKIDDTELKKGFGGALSASLKSPLSIVKIKNVGEKNEKIYGNLRSSSNDDLIIHNSFEEQLLSSKPIIFNWITLYFGAALTGSAILLLFKFFIND